MAVSDATFVIPPGQEACVKQMLSGNAPLPGGYFWTGASIEPTFIRARFESKREEPLVLRLDHASSVVEPRTTTAKFVLSIEGKPNDEFLQAIAERIRATESDFIWGQVEKKSAASMGTPADMAERASREAGNSWALGLASLFVLVALVSRRFRVRPPPPSPEPKEHPTLPILMTAFTLVSIRVILELRHFLLDYDDFDYLWRAVVDPYRPDESARFLSTTILYRLGTYLGAKPWFFMAASTMAFATMLGAWGIFLRRLGFSWYATILAATLWGLSPAPMYLLSWGAGFQQLLGMALLLFSLSAAIDALRAEHRRALVSAAAASMALVAVGVFVKYPLMFLAPPSILLCSFLAIEPKPSLQRSLACASVVSAVIVLLLKLAHLPSNMGDIKKIGFSRLAQNSVDAFDGAISAVVPLLCILLVATIAHIGLSLRNDSQSNTLRQTLVLTWRKFLSLRIGRAHALLFSLLMAGLWLMPFLGNREYFAGYYLSLPAAMLAVYTAHICAALLPSPRWAGWAALTLVAAFPFQMLRADTHQQERERIAAWLTTLADGLRDKPEVDRIVLTVDCRGDGERERQMNEDLRNFVGKMSGEAAIRWWTGRHYVNVTLADDAARAAGNGRHLEVRACHGYPVHVEAP